jgi:hypothetical protein
MRVARLTGFLALCIAITGASAAQDTPASTPREGQSFLYVENDLFDLLGDNTDRWYTQGLRFERINSPETSGGNFLFGLDADFWCFISCYRPYERMTGWAIGQSIFTPEVLDEPDPQPLDRPWAGHLYASRIAQVRQNVPLARNPMLRGMLASRTDRFEFEIGLVGEASGAEWAQTRWHEIIDAEVTPLGWDNQLPNEPTVQTAFRSEFRIQTTPEWGRNVGLGLALQPHYGWDLGTRRVSGEFGLHAEIGWNLFDPGAPSGPAGERRTGTDARDRGWFDSGSVFAAFTGRHVQHNIFLDGTVFRSSPGVRHRKPVWETAIGVQLNVYGPYDLVYRYRRRGSEFERPTGDTSNIQEFGSITLIRRY